jgi:hypothetical protein
MPTFCRHNRFVERCPICSKDLAREAAPRSAPVRRPRSTAGASSTRRRARPLEGGVRVRREARAADDGYRCELVPGLHARADAERLAHELEFASARLLVLAGDPPDLYGELRARATEDLEGATWGCFLLAYLCPLEDDAPFAGIRAALAQGPARGAPPLPGDGGEAGLPDLEGIARGPRSSPDPARGAATLAAYLQWAARHGGQATAFTGDPEWTPVRRFERIYERLALPGLPRAGRYELLVVLGRLGLYPLSPDSLHLGGQRGLLEDPTALAAKRVFGIADPQLLERRAAMLADAAEVPLEALDLALSNWVSEQRVTLGVHVADPAEETLARIRSALEL